MTSHFRRLLPGSVLAALSLVAATTTQAAITNKVTISGKVTSATEPIERETANTYSVSSKLITFSITNASILDAMIADGDLATKTGYTIIERLKTDGDSLGYFAYNARTNHLVAIDPLLFSSILNESSGAEAFSGTARLTSTGITSNIKSNFVGVGAAGFFYCDASTYLTGTRGLIAKILRIDGIPTPVQYTATKYTAVVRALTSAASVIDAKVSSSGTVYVYDAETGTGVE